MDTLDVDGPTGPDFEKIAKVVESTVLNNAYSGTLITVNRAFNELRKYPEFEYNEFDILHIRRLIYQLVNFKVYQML